MKNNFNLRVASKKTTTNNVVDFRVSVALCSESLIQELQKLNLSRYMSEVATAIVDSKLKANDIMAAGSCF